MEPAKKIMLAMLRTMGDVVCATTLVRELKKERPNSEIYVFTDEPYDELFTSNPDVHAVRPSTHWHWDQLYLEWASGNYDEAFFPYQARPECNRWHQEEATRYQHLVDFYWHRMGFHRPIVDRECYLCPSQADFLKASEHISTDVPRIAIHSTTGVATKDWPYFNEVVEGLRTAGYGCVQVGARNDKRVNGAVDLRGRMGMLELAAFLSQCAVFLGLDSGVSYIADAMRTPTIIIQGSTSPITSGPISSRVVHLFARETGYADCQVVRCHAHCRHEVNCNTRVKPQDVLDAIEPILDRWRKPIPAGV